MTTHRSQTSPSVCYTSALFPQVSARQVAALDQPTNIMPMIMRPSWWNVSRKPICAPEQLVGDASPREMQRPDILFSLSENLRTCALLRALGKHLHGFFLCLA